MAGAYFGNSLTATTTSDTSYAGHGAWGQQGTAAWTNAGLGAFVQGTSYTMKTQAMPDSWNYQTQMRVTIPAQRILVMPQQTWANWNENSYTSESISAQTIDYQARVWGEWIGHEQDRQSAQEAAYLLNQRGLDRVREENERRQAEYERTRARYQRAEEEVKKQAERKKTAEDVAQILLGELIGEEQLAVYKQTGRLLVKGKKHDYMVWKSGGVQRVEKGKISDLCVHVQEKILIPPTDNVIGLAMHIKADEKHFNKVANASPPVPRTKELLQAANY